MKNGNEIIKKVENAGSIFIKIFPEAMGDYIAGPNYALPTAEPKYSSWLVS